MLSSLLPGLRHLRTPLLTGSLYFFAIWLMVGGEKLLPQAHPENVLMQRVAVLAALVGPTVTLGAVSVAAYLVGSLLIVPRMGLLGRLMPPAAERWVDQQVEEHARAVDFDSLWLSFKDAVWAEGPLEEGTAGETEKRAARLRGVVADFVRHEFDTLVTRMQIERESLYNDYDRLRSEAELRFSIAPPLVFIVAILATTGSWAFGFGLVLPLFFVAQGYRTLIESSRKVWQALTTGLIESPTIHDFLQAPRMDKVRRVWPDE